MVKRKSILFLVLFASLLPALHAIPVSERAVISEYAIKAAYLFNFSKFVEWPASQAHPSDSFVIGVVGKDPFGKELKDQFTSQIVQDKKLVFHHVTNVEDVAHCHILFIPSSESEALGKILGALENTPVLTVSDMDRFVQRGGMVGFTWEQNKVRFNINVNAAERAGLKISSQLLKLAKSVQGKPAAGGLEP
jgi:hypothetical protein